MIAYGIDYKVRNDSRLNSKIVEAKDIKSAKRKIGKAHGYKDGRMITIVRASVIGYF